MSPVFTAHRRAQEFATLVEDPSTVGTDSARYAELLELVAAMRATPTPVARPEFVADLRGRLLAEAASTTVPAETARLSLPPRRKARERRIAAVVGGIAIVGASTSVAMASEQSLPGDALYPVKRAIEDVHTRISVGDADKGHTVLANAGDRLEEAAALAQSGTYADRAQVGATLDDFSHQAQQATDLLLADYAVSGDDTSVTQLQDFAATSLERLTTLEPTVPGAARDELVTAAKMVVAIDAAAHQACPACGQGITQLPPVFAASAGTAADATGSAADAPGPRGSSSAEHGSQHHGAARSDQGHHGGSSATPTLPGLGQQPLPPGSVLGSTGSDQGGAGSPQGGQDPLDGIVNGLTGGLTGRSPDPSPSVPDLGDTVDGTVDGLGDTVDGATGGVTGGLTDPLTGGN